MTFYEGKRTSSGTSVLKRDGNIFEELPLRTDLANHSPTGFEWSYGGSGPAQLALALLADVLQNDDAALSLYQSFKWEVVATLPWQCWHLSSEEIWHTAQTIREK